MQLRATRLTAISHAVRRAVAPPAFTPATFFASGEQGIWLDPSDFSTMFQDAAGVTPVTAVEQPVGRILDKSGRGNHATQATATSRPILRQDASGRYYLFFDGIDDSLVTGTITPGTDKVQVFAGTRYFGDAVGVLLELSSSLGGATGAFLAAVNDVIPGRESIGARVAVTAGVQFIAPNNTTRVTTRLIDLAQTTAGAEFSMRINGVLQAPASTTQQESGAGNFGSYPLFIGRRNQASFPFSGHIYQLVSRFGPNLAADQITQAETFFNGKTGAY